MNIKISTVFTWLLALLLIVFGANKFLHFANVPPPIGKSAQLFLSEMFSSYLYIFVGFIEIIGGFLLLFSKTKFIGVLLLLPIISNIIWFHIAYDFVGNGIWIFTSVCFVIVCLPHKNNFIQLLKN